MAAEVQYHQFYINGRFVEMSGAESFSSIEPATEEVLTKVGLASARVVDEAVRAARLAFDEGPWPRMRAAERASLLREAAALLEERSEELAELESRDTGMPWMMTAAGHLPRAVAHLRHFAAEAERLEGHVYPMDEACLSLVLREPVGVVALLTPWNAPLSVATMGVAAALCCGNTCVLKPSELAPLSASRLAAIFDEVGLPPGVFNLVQGPGNPTGQGLVHHSGVDVISFTGGTDTGRQVMAAAAGTLKRVGLELGGKSASILLADCDFERALDGALLMIFGSNGEACMAGSRILVQRPLYETFLDAFVTRARSIRVGDPLDPDTEMGPLVSRAHREQVLRHIHQAEAEGARLLCGGRVPEGRGFYLPPTVLAGVDNRMRIAQEELFAPVAAFIPFEDEEEALRLANASPYGLAGYVWSQDTERALRMARRLRVGTVTVNSPIIRDIRAPFGGYKQSGLGRTGGRYSLELFTELKTTCLPLHPLPLPRLGHSS
jgi:5-carboxymethyl-2-hydroxymuconic-semialdehyde dehydrogenase